MNKTFETDHWKWDYNRFRSAPIGLQAFTIFSLIATLYGVLIILGSPKIIRDAIIPFTGWTGSSMYMFGLFFTFALLFLKNHRKVSRLRLLFGVVSPLFIYSIFSIVESLELLNHSYENPDRVVSQWKPVWTIILPMLWIVVLLSSGTRKFCQLDYK